MKQYKCLAQAEYREGEFSLVSIREEDIQQIKDWRNQQMTVLRQQAELTEAGQVNYFDKHVWPLFTQVEPTQILFSFLKQGRCIAYGGFVHVDWNDERAEISFLAETAAQNNIELYTEYFNVYLALIKKIAFTDVGFNRLHVETYDLRPYHVNVLEEAGFTLEGRMCEYLKVDGNYVDSLIHAYLKKNYVKK